MGNQDKLYNEIDAGAEEWTEFVTEWYDAYKENGKTSREILDDLRNTYLDISAHAPEELAKKLTKFEGPGDAKIVGQFLSKKLNVRCKVDIDITTKDGNKKTIKYLMLVQEEDTNRKIKVWKLKEAIDHQI